MGRNFMTELPLEWTVRWKLINGDKDQPGSIGAVVVSETFWPFETISASKSLPTSMGSGA